MLCLSIGLTQYSYSQKKELCIKKYIGFKDQLQTDDYILKTQYDVLDSLLTNCKYEDQEWITKVLASATLRKDTLLNHSFPWNYYVYLYRQSDREEDATKILDYFIDYSHETKYPLNGDFYIERGIRYETEGDYAKQLNAYQKGLSAYQRDESDNIIYALGVLGKFHLEIGALDKAKDYKLGALELAKSLEIDYLKYYNLSNICLDLGAIYLKKDSLAQAEKYYQMALNAALKQKNNNLTLSIYDELTQFLISQERYDEAEELIISADLQKDKAIKKGLWNYKIQYLAYHDLTKSKFGLQALKTKFLKNPKDISLQNIAIKDLKEFYKYAIDYSELYSDHKTALKYSKELNKTIEQETKDQKISAIDMLIEKQNFAQLQEENNLLLDTKRKQQIQKYFYISLVFFLAITLMFLYYFLKRSNEYNKRIKGKRKEIELQYAELERITYVMTHDLKEPINTVNSFTTLLLNRHSEGLDANGKKYFNIIEDTSKTMLSLVNNLHNYLLLGVRSQLKKIDLELAWSQAQTNLKASINKSNAIIRSEKLPILSCYEEDIIILFQSLISNSIKYAKKEIPPKINLRCLESSEFYTFELSDNGIGLNENMHDSVFDLFKRVSADSNIEGSGIGLANARKIVENHQGEIWIKSKLHEGCTFYFTISKNLN